MLPARKQEVRAVLSMGETAILRDSGEIICYGLGSCVGVFLYDKFKKVGAAAHIMLPSKVGRPESDNMMKEIIDGMLDLGCHNLTIRAKIIGGADIMNINSYQIGSRNIEYARMKLKKAGVLILAENTGGFDSRTAKLDIKTGVLSINNSQKNNYTI